MTIIETQNLDFGFYKNDLVLSNLNLQVEKGSIYGFLGPNGSGKTTTIRLLLGLIPNPANNIKLFEQNLQSNRIGILSKTGSLIEQPSLYEHLSGFDNLEITRRTRKVNKDRIDKILELVDLKSSSKKKVKAYSLGMKQRLGLAIALLSEPELLILDEPVNGLDPGGIAETRDILVKLNKELGTTIFLSSHLLAEIEKMVTHVGIINKGEMLFQGKFEELNKLNAKTAFLCVETNDNVAAAELLRGKFEVHENKNALQISIKEKEQSAEINRSLIDNHIEVYQSFIKTKDLEHLFLQLTESPKS